jgi:PEP-CTERM motif
VSHIEISPAVWAAQEHRAGSYRAIHDDHLPQTPFWLCVDEDYLQAVNSDHLARFERWHGWKVTFWEEQNYAPSAPATIPSVAVRVVLPGPPTSSLGSIPEPSAITLLGLGVAWIWLIGGIRRKPIT